MTWGALPPAWIALAFVAPAALACRGGVPAAPEVGPSSVSLVGPEEPGRRLVLAGRVFEPDGVTPLPGARLDLYHTDAGGYYTRPVSVARRARLRGSVWTDAEGRYEIRTILPGRYPSGGEPAHVHAHLAAPGVPDHWIESFLFAGDPKISDEARQANAGLGSFSAIVVLEEGEDGILHGTRDLRLDPAWAEKNFLVDGWYQGE